MARKYDFDFQAFNAWRQANQGLSGRGGPYTDGSGTNAMVYDSMPLSATGGAWNYGGMVIQPLLDEPGNYIVYHGNNEPGKASRLNGTIADKYDSQGNLIGDYTITGATDNNAGADFLTGAAMMALPMYMTASGVGAAGVGGGSQTLGSIGMSGNVPAGQGFGITSGFGGELPSLANFGGQPLGEVGAGWLSSVAPETAAMGAGAAGAGATGFNFTPSILPEATTLTGGQSLASGLPSVTEAGLFSNPAAWTGWGNIPAGAGYGLGAGALGAAGAAGASGATGAGAAGARSAFGKLLGPAATALGALSGSQGQQDSATQTQQLPDFLQAPVAQDLIPRTQGLLAAQAPAASVAGQQMTSTGAGLLARPVAGNGFDQVKLEMPTTAQNPYLSSLADDIGRRTQEMLGQNNLAIQGNAVGVGGLGGSRQGVAQGIAAGKAADYLQGNLAGMYGNAWNADANRAMTKYTADQGFYGQQRQQDLAQTSMGAGLLSTGIDTAWQPLKNAAGIYGNFSPYGSKTTSTEQGGGWQGLLGGALAGGSLAKQAGWW